MQKAPTPRQMRREERKRRDAEHVETFGYSGVDPQACSKCCETTADICCGIKCTPENKTKVYPAPTRQGGRKTRRKRRKKRRKTHKKRRKTKRKKRRRKKKKSRRRRK